MVKKRPGALGGEQIRPFILIIVFIVLLIIWQFHTVNELENNAAGKPSSITSVPSAVVNNTATQIGEVSVPGQGSVLLPGGVNPAIPVTQNAAALQVPNASVKTSTASFEEELQSGSTQTALAGIVAPALGNSIPTQEQISMGISKQIAMRQRVEKAVGERKRKIEDVHQAIINSGVLNTTTLNKTFVEPNLNTPQDIVEKIRSKQLTAH